MTPVPRRLAYALGAAIAAFWAMLQWLVHPRVNRLHLSTNPAAVTEKRLALAQRNTGVGIFELDFVAGTAFVSPSLCHILGRELLEGEISLERWLNALHPDHLEESRRAMQIQIERGELRYEREQRIELPTGEIRWLLNRVELEATPDGILTHARGATVDISARKRVDVMLQRTQLSLEQQLHDQARLHAFSQKLVAAGDDVPAAMQSLLDIIVDLYGTSHGVVSLCNAENKAIYVVAQSGFDEGSVERTISSLGVPGSRPSLPPVTPAIADADYESIFLMHRTLGSQSNLAGLHTIALRSATGRIMGAISVMFAEPHDPGERELRLGEVCATTAAAIVDREGARAAATKNEKRFSVALESSVVPFSILSPVRNDGGDIVDFKWSYLNPAAARAIGRDIEDLLDNGIRDVLPAAWDAPGLFERYVSVVEHGEQWEFELRTSASNQGIRWYSVVAAPLHGSAAVWFANITESKERQQRLEDADRRKDEFLATLAHELRNPLAPIRQAVRIARADHSTDAQRRWSHAIVERQVTHMSLLLDDLLDVSRVGRGTLLLRKSSEALSGVIDTAIETARPHIEAKRHHFTVELPPTPVLLNIDPVRMSQVLGNLLTNAAKYTEPGGRILLRAGREADEFVMRVADNGIGLTPAQHADVFEMFSQVSAAIDKSQGGLGIGLALARGLIELHGGTIEAHSAGLGHGTEFIVRLPADCMGGMDHRNRPIGAEPPAVTAPARAAPHRRILIADDNADAADSLAELLRLDGYEVHVAYDGAQALAIFARVEPDAALLDVGMPQISGLDVVRALRQWPAGQRATLIAVTGWGQEHDRRIALDAGFDYHVTKPMLPEDVAQLLGQGRPESAKQPV